MAYTINLTNGSVFAVIPDGTVNTSSSMTLIGKNYAGYGQFLNDNLIHLLENAANTTAPPSPLTGQLWWDSTNTLLKVYSGTGGWKVITGATASATQPTPNIQGDLWYDSTNQQLKVCSVAGNPGTFIVVGPAYSSAQGTSGAIPLSINDTGATPHIVTGLYANNSLVAIVSPDANFTPVSPFSTAFPTIFRGTTVWNTGVNAGNIAGASNVTITSAGTTTATVSSTGLFVTGVTSASGNITGANLVTGGLITATGNITGANLVTGGLATVTGNVAAGNILTGGLISATGNITGGNVMGGANVNATTHTGTTVSVTGNVTAGNVLTGGLISATGNVTAGNLISLGAVSATGNLSAAGNVAGTFFLGNGALLTGLSLGVTVTKFTNGSSEGNAGTPGGNINFNVGGVANVMVLTTTGAVVSGVSTPSITKTGTNAVGNIGSASSYFERVFATATTALYADVAERFEADELLQPGTVVELGGTKEITRAQQDLSEKVFGVISTKPAYTMNGAAGEDDTHPPVAMTGRVPVQVVGVIHKGDRLVSAGSGSARAAKPGEATAFNVIGRALVDKLTPEPGTIEAIVTIK
jgi:hypothetical protein